jgi:two-component sensor histidine kinase/putative methionine-R-sulfoxide reductase with GAF domain
MPKVLIAENELLLADMLEEDLIHAGYEVCGIARTVEEGVELGSRHDPDLVLLDLRLASGGLGTEIAARLDRESGLGILYATGTSDQFHLTRADGDACLVKPYRSEDIVRALKIVEEVVSTGRTVLPFPGGFRLLETSSVDAAEGTVIGKDADGFTIARLLRQQAALAEFGGFALGKSDLSAVLNEAARVCAECLDVPFSKVCRYRTEENDLLVEAGVGWKSGVIGHDVSRADRSSPQGRAFSTGSPVICVDLARDSSYVLPPFYAEHSIVSTLDVVIKNKEGQPWGVLEIDNPKRHVYDEHDINFVTGFANVLAEAVNSSKRNDAIQAALRLTRDMVADRDRLLTSQARLLSEKGVLAQELQHRVRNNLQLVYGMLNKHLQSPDEGSATSDIAAIARRVLILARVYDHLLGTGLTRTIDFGGYLASLCDSFRDLERERPGNRDIELTCRCKPLMLDLDTATALGLVVAELISNSYLHAFPVGWGTISVSLLQGASGEDAEIEFIDNGVGFIDVENDKRHGIGLVRRLMEQIEGSAKLQSEKGSVWTLKFPVPAFALNIDTVG